MLAIDKTNILSLKRDELGTWTAEVSYGETNFECSWDAAAPEEQADKKRDAILNFIDVLCVSAVRDMIGDGEEEDLDDCDVLGAVLAAERIGDDEIGGVVVEAWSRGLLAIKPTPKPLPPSYEEGDAEDVDPELAAALARLADLRKQWDANEARIARALRGPHA